MFAYLLLRDRETRLSKQLNKMKNKEMNTIIWSNREITNSTIETSKRVRIVDNESWKDAGLNHEAVAIKISLKDNTYDYFLNYYAVEVIKNKLSDSWTIPTSEEWRSISETKAVEFKQELIGSVTQFGKQVNINFSTGYWTNDLQGESHAFAAVLTNLNNKVYNKSFPLKEGYMLRLIKKF